MHCLSTQSLYFLDSISILIRSNFRERVSTKDQTKLVTCHVDSSTYSHAMSIVGFEGSLARNAAASDSSMRSLVAQRQSCQSSTDS